jgi:hypothetical protein
MQANGGTLPTTTSGQTAITAKLQHAQCLAAKALAIQINPQFGQLNYSHNLGRAADPRVARTAPARGTGRGAGCARIR